MAGIVYITEYGALTQLAGDAGQMPDENTKMAEQTLTIATSPSSTASNALNPGTKFVRLNCDTACCIEFAFGTVGVPPTPTAIGGAPTPPAAASQRFAANQTEYKGVPTNGNGSGNAQIQVKIAAATVTV